MIANVCFVDPDKLCSLDLFVDLYEISDNSFIIDRNDIKFQVTRFRCNEFQENYQHYNSGVLLMDLDGCYKDDEILRSFIQHCMFLEIDHVIVQILSPEFNKQQWIIEQTNQRIAQITLFNPLGLKVPTFETSIIQTLDNKEILFPNKLSNVGLPNSELMIQLACQKKKPSQAVVKIVSGYLINGQTIYDQDVGYQISFLGDSVTKPIVYSGSSIQIDFNKSVKHMIRQQFLFGKPFNYVIDEKQPILLDTWFINDEAYMLFNKQYKQGYTYDQHRILYTGSKTKIKPNTLKKDLQVPAKDNNVYEALHQDNPVKLVWKPEKSQVKQIDSQTNRQLSKLYVINEETKKAFCYCIIKQSNCKYNYILPPPKLLVQLFVPREEKDCIKELKAGQAKQEGKFYPMCRVCKEQKADCLLIPCGHLRYCTDCCQDQKECLYCNEMITHRKRISVTNITNNLFKFLEQPRVDFRKLINQSLKPELPPLNDFKQWVEFENIDKQQNYYCFGCEQQKTENYEFCSKNHLIGTCNKCHNTIKKCTIDKCDSNISHKGKLIYEFNEFQ